MKYNHCKICLNKNSKSCDTCNEVTPINFVSCSPKDRKQMKIIHVSGFSQDFNTKKVED